MPSLHTAFATIIALLRRAADCRSPWRWLMALYPAGDGPGPGYLGEHYVVDVIAGVVYALVTHFVVCRWESLAPTPGSCQNLLTRISRHDGLHALCTFYRVLLLMVHTGLLLSMVRTWHPVPSVISDSGARYREDSR